MKKQYALIIQVEFMVFRNYRIDPYSMFANISVTDFQSLVQKIEIQAEKDKQDKQGDRLMKSLVAIRDILNYMTLPVK